MKLAMIGLGRMGANMVRRLRQGEHEVVVYNRTASKAVELAQECGAEAATTLRDVVEKLPSPRVVWLMVPAGKAVDEMIDDLLPMLDEGDILIDGGNSRYTDDPLHYERCAHKGVKFLDVGTSGGIWGLEVGYCLMIGGDNDAFGVVEPAFKTLAPENGYMHCGPSGAGHYVKMVHNAIEYGMMQAYAEGFALLENSDYGASLDYSRLSNLWNQGSVIRSWLLELAEKAFAESPRLGDLQAYVDDSGEGRWAVEAAVETATSAPVITLALMERFRSRSENDFGNRVLAALRKEFGGHAVKHREE